MIQGSAGIGKSTLCHNIAFRWAKGELFQEFKYLFWVRLRNLNKELNPSQVDLAEFLANECNIKLEYIQAFLDKKDLRHKALILLDGYDELSPEAVNERGSLYPILQDLRNFPNVIITTRPQIVVGFNSVCNFEILGFDSRGVDKYVNQFFSENEPDQTPQQKAHAQGLRKQLKNPLVRSLARIPINLEIFCSLVAAGESLFASPEAFSITSLYRRLTTWLYERFNTQRREPLKEAHDPEFVDLVLDDEQIKDFDKLLGEIAWKAMQENTLYINAKSIMPILREAKILHEKALTQIGPLRIEDGEGVFIHLTFQEFYAGVYLAHLFETNPTEAQETLKRIKFEPRYMLVLRMTAGLLSQNSDKTLQLFFNGLFSEPRDIAQSYVLRVQAGCFEECKQPDFVSQYENFINQIVLFIERCQYEKLIINLLIGNNNLFFNDKIVNIFTHKIQNEVILYVLRELVISGQLLHPTILKALASVIFKRKVNEDIKDSAAYILEKVAESRQSLPTEVVKKIIGTLSSPNLDEIPNDLVSKILEMVARGEQPLAAEAMSALVATILKPNINRNRRSSAASALGRIAESGQSLPAKAVKGLNKILLNPEEENNVKCSAAETLGKMAENRQSLPTEAVRGLLVTLSNPRVRWDVKGSVAKTLERVDESGQILVSKDVNKHIKVLFNHRENGVLKWLATQAIRKSVENEQPLPAKALKGLTLVLLDSNLDTYVKKSVVDVLVKIAQNGQTLSEIEENEFISVLLEPSLDMDIKTSLIDILQKTVDRKQFLSEEAVGKLVDALLSPEEKVDQIVKKSSSDALRAVLEKGQPLTENVVVKLCEGFLNPNIVGFGKFLVSFVLGKVVETRCTYAALIIDFVTKVLLDPDYDCNIKESAIRVLEHAVSGGEWLSDEVFEWCVERLLTPVIYVERSHVQILSSIAQILQTAIDKGRTLPPGVAEGLINILRNPFVVSKDSAAIALGKLAEKGHPLPIEAIKVLICVLLNPDLDQFYKHSAAKAIEKIIESKPTSVTEVVNKLIEALSESEDEMDFYSKIFAAEILQNIARQETDFPEVCLRALIESYETMYLPVRRNVIDEVLDKIVERQNYTWTDNNYKILAKMYFLTGHALFYRDGTIYASRREGAVSLNISDSVVKKLLVLDPKNFYDEGLV